jgi:hypothetical protein
VAVALRGNLSDFGIGEVFQLIGQQRKTGLLEVDQDGRRLHVSFAEGCVVWAAPALEHEDSALAELLVRTGALTPEQLVELEPHLGQPGALRRLAVQEARVPARQIDALEELLTRETVFELLRWSSGSFHFTARKLRERGRADRRWPAEQILMDGLRMVDEWRTLDPDARREDAVFRCAAPFDVYRASVRGESAEQLAAAARLYELADGQRTARRLFDRVGLATFEGARLLSGLRRAGALEPVAGRPAAAPAAPPPRVATPRAPARLARAIAAALPFAALALVAWLAQRPPAPAPRGLVPEPVAAARAAAAAGCLRNAAEAFRFLHGRGPRDLAELAAEGWPVDAPMAGPGADPYVMRGAAGDAFAVLAPET